MLDAEMQRAGFKFWYRNPDHSSQDSLGIAYTDSDETRTVRPDFVFFAEQDGKLVVNVVDPHGFHLADALPMLQGPARCAEAHLDAFRRSEAVADLNDNLRVLNLTQYRSSSGGNGGIQRGNSLQKCGGGRLQLTIGDRSY